MMKNEKGVTLTAMVVTIIVLLIILSVSISVGSDSINESRDKNRWSEIETIQQAAITEYTKAQQLGLTGSSTQPTNFVGTQVSASSLPSLTSETGTLTWQLTDTEIGTDASKMYYRLTTTNLASLNITSSNEYTYIINYYTGEVYNETKTTTDGYSLYISGSIDDGASDDVYKESTDTDTTSYVDGSW